MAARYNAETKTFILETAHSSYMMKVSRYGNLLHMYYGSRIPDEDLDYLLTFSDRGFSPNPYEAGNDRTFSLDFLPQEFSGSRSGDYRSSSLELVWGEGGSAFGGKVAGYEIRKGACRIDGMPGLWAESQEQAETLTICLADPVSKVEAELSYTIFAEKDVIKPRDFLEKYSIYYEENGNRLMVSNSDIPSASVTRMYLKESIYFDQRTSSFHKQVTALCPVLVREDDFGGASTPYPLFWVKYSDAAPFLSKLPMMGSNYNNVTNMTADDYFTLNRYDGKIYKTNNLQGRVLANYCKTDSALTKEQNRIEQELKDLELSVWGQRNVASDSLNVAEDEGKAEKKSEKKSEKTTVRRSSKKEKSEKVKTVSTKSTNTQAAPRVSVRRQRR